jgi:ketosteroid isomerase-like protein
VPSEDVRLVREWFEGFERAELGLHICDPEIEIRNWAEFPITGPYRGHEGVRHWWDDIDEAFDELQWELLDLIDAGDGRVVTIQRFRGRFRLTGLETNFAWGAVITVREGKIASAHGYPSPRRAKEAAGL